MKYQRSNKAYSNRWLGSYTTFTCKIPRREEGGSLCVIRNDDTDRPRHRAPGTYNATTLARLDPSIVHLTPWPPRTDAFNYFQTGYHDMKYQYSLDSSRRKDSVRKRVRAAWLLHVIPHAPVFGGPKYHTHLPGIYYIKYAYMRSGTLLIGLIGNDHVRS
ncbi:hypothetical protein B0J17DRAFT_633630 [Rhizoctonia solani]|nr:hypothetical protein B0J17DRAFT_633630 [Rhizoctonia solani]